MKILFSCNTLNHRGTTAAALDYAKYNQEILGNESVITYNSTIPKEVDMGNEESVITDIRSKFQLIANEGRIEPVLNGNNFDLVYRIGAGDNLQEPELSVKSVYHAVFQFQNPEITAYVSKWLSEWMSVGDEFGDFRELPYVPHIVNLPEPNKDYRKFLNIPNDAIVIGRHGGYYTFDIPWVKQNIIDTIDANPNHYYIFVNTKPFIEHKRVIYIGAITERQKLSNFINTCDVMLHARERGESFGLAIAEFMSLGKPVLAYNGGVDRNHCKLLEDIGTLYSNASDINHWLEDRNRLTSSPELFKGRVSEFRPEQVMKKFHNVFIEG